MTVAPPKAASVDKQWLARYDEEVLEPNLPIVDAHHHLWDVPGYEYHLDDLLDDVNSGHNVRSTVFVQCGWSYRAGGPDALKPVGETERVAAAAAEAARKQSKVDVCAAIVGHADLNLGAAVQDVLDAHIVAANGRFRGIRQISALDDAVTRHLLPKPLPQLFGRSDFREGFSRLAPSGLSFDAWLYHPQLPELTDLARAFPHTPIMLNHMGGILGVGPYNNRRTEIFETWQRDIRELATCANVSVKLGGIGLAVSGRDYHLGTLPPNSNELAQHWQPYVETCIEAFGVSRCMFESNFPVDKAACAYRVLWNTFKRMTAGASADEKIALFHDNAKRFYRI
jgi:predicted TIM-barrel fold metal-dependent hydrolase